MIVQSVNWVFKVKAVKPDKDWLSSGLRRVTGVASEQVVDGIWQEILEVVVKVNW